MGNTAATTWEQYSPTVRRWLLLGLGVGALGLAAWVARWLLQGEGIVYSDTARAFWVPHATLGWIETEARWLWLGLDGLAIGSAIVLGTAVLLMLSLRLARGEGKAPGFARLLRVGAIAGAGLALLTPILPAWAFITGFPPDGARRLLPTASAPVDVSGRTDAPAVPALPVRGGRWLVADVPATLVVARIAAGGEDFDARFGPTTGEILLEPGRLERTTGWFEVPTGSIDTGVEMRNGHARGYLEAEQNPTIRLTLGAVSNVQVEGAGYAFTAQAELALLGRELPVAVSGRLVVLDDKARAELTVSAPEALLATVSFPLAIADTGLKRDNFDADAISLTGRIVLVPGGASP